MRYLFFFVHPSKFYVFRKTINNLISKGHDVEVLITSKDVLEELLKTEKWSYTNIFPEGRKMKGINPLISSAINVFRTLWRLYKYCRKKKYDLFITDDFLTYIGKLKRVPSIVLLDDDLDVVKPFALILYAADYILTPDITRLGKFEHKRIGFPGYKELAYLHPNTFVPNPEIIKSFNPDFTDYFVLRLVSLRAFHDVGMKGLTNEKVKKLIALLETKGKVFISSERQIPEEFEKYRLKTPPTVIQHILYYAKIFIGDSQTMTSEAAILGTPAFRCNDFVGRISVMEEKEVKYGLSFNFPPSKFDDMYEKIKELISNDGFKDSFAEKRQNMLNDKIDLSMFMTWLFENTPVSLKEIKNNPDKVRQFK